MEIYANGKCKVQTVAKNTEKNMWNMCTFTDVFTVHTVKENMEK